MTDKELLEEIRKLLLMVLHMQIIQTFGNRPEIVESILYKEMLPLLLNLQDKDATDIADFVARITEYR